MVTLRARLRCSRPHHLSRHLPQAHLLLMSLMITIKINSRLYTIDSNPHYLEPRFNSNQNRVPLVFCHTFTVILPSVTRTLDDLNLPLTRSSFSFPSDHFYRIHGSAVGKWNKISSDFSGQQRTQGAWIHMGGYGRFRSEVVKVYDLVRPSDRELIYLFLVATKSFLVCFCLAVEVPKCIQYLQLFIQRIF